MPYPILDPTGTALTAAKTTAPRAPRRRNLHGATVGLLVNTKQNAAPFLDEVGLLLTERHGVTNVMARTKVNFAQPAPDELVKEMTTACDVIITGIGDCGSCSASAVADGIAFAAAGLRRGDLQRFFGEWSGTASPVERMIDTERAGEITATLAADGPA